MGDVVVYVDGFNLYNGLRRKHDHAYLWLDVFELAHLMRQGDQILTVRYYTAIVKGEPDAARRQEIYLAALTAHRPAVVDVNRGHFKVKTFRSCRKCDSPWTCECDPPKEFKTYEEKLTDVALASAMVRDAAVGHGDITVLVSTDTDFQPAIRACLELAPARPILIACPPGRHSPRENFGGRVTAFAIKEEHLAAAQLPDKVTAADGRIYIRPDKWA